MGIFILILTLVKLKVDLGLTLILSSVLVAIFFRSPTSKIIDCLLTGVVGIDTLKLLEIVFLALTLSSVMDKAGYLKKIVFSTPMISSDPRWIITFIPALIGLLPMPAGALVSAIMVGELFEQLGIGNDVKTLLNYWFRHIWEYSWPLYPGILLQAAVLGVSVLSLSLHQMYLTIIAVFLGLYFIRRGVTGGKNREEILNQKNVLEGVKGILGGYWPILAIVLGGIVLKISFLWILPVVVILTILVGRLSKEDVKESLKEAFSMEIISSLIGVMVFKTTIEKIEVFKYICSYPVIQYFSPFISSLITSFLIGLLTGVTVAFVGVTYPLFKPFLVLNGSVNFCLSSFIFAFGFAGCLLSPLHLCLIFSSKYFKANLHDVYRKLVPLVIVLLMLQILLFLVFLLAGFC